MFSSFYASAVAILASTGQAQDPAIDALVKRIQNVKGKLQDLKANLPIDVGELGESVTYRGDSLLVLTSSYQQHSRNTDRPDGAASATFVFGRPEKLTVDIPVSFTDLSSLGRRGSIGVRFSRVLSPGLSASIGLDQFIEWGKSDTFRGVSVRINKVVSLSQPAWQRDGNRDARSKRLASPFQRVVLQFGVGNGRYGPEGALNRLDNQTGRPSRDLNRWGAFGGATFFLDDEVQFFLRYAAHDWSTGITLRPADSPIYGTIAVTDIFGSSAQYLWTKPGLFKLTPADSPRLLITLGYVLRF